MDTKPRMLSLRLGILLIVGSLAITVGMPASAAEGGLAQNSDCTFDVAKFRSPHERWRDLTRRAEVIANAAASGRRRGVRPGSRIPLPNNFIDDYIFGKMVSDGIRPTRPTTDEEFIRRATLSLTGDIPSPVRVIEFLQDERPDKRDLLLDELLASEGYVNKWTMWFGDQVQNVRFATNFDIGTSGMLAYNAWIREAITEGMPYDRMVSELIDGDGDSVVDGEANYVVRQIQANGPPQDTYDNLAAHSSQKFLALPLECLSCHSGPFHLELVNSYLAKRTRSEFWGSAAFFARTAVTFVRGDDIRFIVNNNNVGQYNLNTTDGNKTPRISPTGDRRAAPVFFLDGGTPDFNESWRHAYARLLTGHRQFARATVNYLWAELFHLGIVEPVDSFDLARLDPLSLAPGAELQPTHPELLEELTDAFIASNYDLRALLKLMTQSKAWQLSTEYSPGEWSETWTPYFARHYPRRLPAEVLYDAIGSATYVRVAFRFDDDVQLDRAMYLPDPTIPGPRNPSGEFLDSFGRGDRDDEPRTYGGSVIQALNLLNSPLITNRVRQTTRGSAVQLILEETQDPFEAIAWVYLSTLSRLPSEEEYVVPIEEMISSDNPAQVIEDLQFGLLNSLEFLFN